MLDGCTYKKYLENTIREKNNNKKLTQRNTNKKSKRLNSILERTKKKHQHLQQHVRIFNTGNIIV